MSAQLGDIYLQDGGFISFSMQKADLEATSKWEYTDKLELVED